MNQKTSPIVILTRESFDNVELAARLKKHGIRALAVPSITTRRLPITKRTRSILNTAAEYDRIIFTSKKAQRFFTQELSHHRIAMPHRHMVYIGPSNNLQTIGSVKNKRILFPRSALGLSDIARTLRAQGARVTVVRLYTTIPAHISRTTLRPLFSGMEMTIVFASPSAVTGFMKNIPVRERRNVRRMPAVCIGRTTTEAAKRGGFTHIHTAKTPSARGITKVIHKLIG